MLPGLDFTEVIIVIVLALLVLGPKDLPLMMRKIGRFMARMRGLASEFRTGFDELARQAELDELRKEVDALRRTTRDGFASVADEFTRPVQEVREALAQPTSPERPEAASTHHPDPGNLPGDPPGEAAPVPYDPEPPAVVPAAPQAAGGAR